MKINNGDIVTVNKGAVVKSYNPSKSEYVLERSQRVKVDHQYSAVFKWMMVKEYVLPSQVSSGLEPVDIGVGQINRI